MLDCWLVCGVAYWYTSVQFGYLWGPPANTDKHIKRRIRADPGKVWKSWNLM